MKQILSINPFLRVKSATHLASLVMATLLLAACGGGGGGGGGGGASAPALATDLNSVQSGIAISWTNPADVREITITRIVYSSADAAGAPQSSETHSNVNGNSALIAAGPITLNITGTTTNRYYSFNITRGYDGGRTDTLLSARQYLPPPTGSVEALLTTDATEAMLRWANPLNVAGITSVRITRQTYLTKDGAADGGPVTTTTTDATVITSTNTGTTPATLDITGLTADRYYTFTVTPIYTGNVEGPTSAATTRLYLPPAIAGAVTATLGEGNTSVLLSWDNPQNVAGITSVRLTRNEFADATITTTAFTPTTKDYTDATAIASTNTGETQATLTISTDDLTVDNYYTFTVTPIYASDAGNLVGSASSASNRVGPIASSTNFGALTARISGSGNSAILAFTNPDNVESIAVTGQAFDVVTGGVAIRDLDLSSQSPYTNPDNIQSDSASITVTGLDPNNYYEFTIIRTLTSGNPIPSTPSNRVYTLPADTITNAAATLNSDGTRVQLSWANPAVLGGLLRVNILRTSYTSLSNTSSTERYIVPSGEVVGITTSTSPGTPTDISVSIPTGSTANIYYEFSITPVFGVPSGSQEGRPSSSSNRIYVPPSVSDVTAVPINSNSAVLLSWTNPTNAAGIESIRITSQGYDAATEGNTDGGATSMEYTASSDTESSNLMPVTNSRQLSIGENGLEVGKHYEFIITPTYTGGIEGPRSAATTNRVELLGLPSVIDLSAGANDAVVRLTWTNPADVLGVTITQTSGGSTTTIVDNANTENLIRQGSKAFHDVQGLTADTSYTFSVTPRYAGDDDGVVSSTNPISLRAAGSGHSDFDDVPDFEDVDRDGDGLIELYNVNDLNLVRDDLTGASFAGNSSGCGGGFDSEGLVVEECNGYELMAHLDLNDLESDLSISNWEPIASCFAGSTNSCGVNSFRGTFDGNNYNISNMRIIETTASNNVGFFGAVSSTELRNLVIKNASISIMSSSASGRIGGLAGGAENSKIINSAVEFSSFDFTRGSYVGGLVGFGNNVQIISSTVIGNSIIVGMQGSGLGGIIGRMIGTSEIVASSTVIASLALGPASGQGGAGGLVGLLLDADGSKVSFVSAITNSLGDQTDGTTSIGGLIGDITRSTNVLVNVSYVLSNNIRGFYNSNSATSFSTGELIGSGTITELSSYYNVTSLTSPPNLGRGTELNAVGSQPSLQPDSFSNTGDADFTSWGQGWCDKTTGEFTQDPASDLAMSNGGANYAWDIGAGKFPVPACTPFSPEILRTAIGKVRNAEDPVPIN